MFEKLKKLFTPAEGIDADTARKYMKDHEEGTYTLLDVRQPAEYERAHIPAAELIPLPRLADELDRLDKQKPVIVYCAIGGRSRVAAQMLSGYGFEKVYNLNGGINAWNGITAAGPEELNLDLIRGDETPIEIVKLAYRMETALGDFYRTVATMTADREVADLANRLAAIEDRHKGFLSDLLGTLDSSGISAAIIGPEDTALIMEGGFSGEELIERNRGLLQSVPNLLDLSLMIEAQALDLYLRFAGKMEDESTRDALRRIAEEEKAHLAALGELRGQRT
jgi:sulfur-carrier protein adenylyltransferase/sulfurtransferase